MGDGRWWEFYQDPSGHWRWQCLDKDDQIVSVSVTGYEHLIDCIRNARRSGFSTEQLHTIGDRSEPG
jgi:uncharacterized protein YegP (UPF0339 family)